MIHYKANRVNMRTMICYMILVELRISDDPEQFKRLVEDIRKKLGGRWIEKLDGLDQSYWDLDVQGEKVTLHREHYLGVSVFCDDQPAKVSVLERLQSLLEADATK